MDRGEAERLWAEHMAAAFPHSARGQVVDGVDLVFLDSSAAGAAVSALAGQADYQLLSRLADELES